MWLNCAATARGSKPFLPEDKADETIKIASLRNAWAMLFARITYVRLAFTSHFRDSSRQHLLFHRLDLRNSRLGL